MLEVRRFLRNHSPIYRWEDLSDEVKLLFASAVAPMAWAEFYIADLKHRRYAFEFVCRSEPEPCWYRADMVMLQESYDLLTLISLPRKKGHLAESIGLNASKIESAVFKARKQPKK